MAYFATSSAPIGLANSKNSGSGYCLKLTAKITNKEGAGLKLRGLSYRGAFMYFQVCGNTKENSNRKQNLAFDYPSAKQHNTEPK